MQTGRLNTTKQADNGNPPDEGNPPDAVRTVLFSAVGSDMADPPNIFGQPLIALQIRTLARHGITRFCIEVEQISENLVAAADALRNDKIDVSFVRGVAELRQAAAPADMLCVVANGIYCDPQMLSQLVETDAAAVLVFADEAAGAGFERIDRQYHWSGLARVKLDALSDMDELPEGWSLPSALMRATLQSGAELLALGKQELRAASLQYIADQGRADNLGAELLRNSNSVSNGAIERLAFKPAIAAIAAIQPVFLGHSATAGMLFAILSFAFAIWGVMLPTFLIGFGALFFISAARISADIQMRTGRNYLLVAAFAFLGAALLISAWHSDHVSGVFASIVALGLLAAGPRSASRRLDTHWPTIASPAALALLAAIAVPFGALLIVIQLFVLLQLTIHVFSPTKVK